MGFWTYFFIFDFVVATILALMFVLGVLNPGMYGADPVESPEVEAYSINIEKTDLAYEKRRGVHKI